VDPIFVNTMSGLNEGPPLTLFQRRPMMKYRAASLMFLFALFVLGVSVRADEKATPATSQRFEALKKLAGAWVEIGSDGKPTDKIVSSIRVTSGGNTVQETLFPGSDHEMVTMYHLDGADLLLTHYCHLGNQPRMRAEPGQEANKIVFKFVGATNLKSNDDTHMHQAILTIESQDHFKAEWTLCKEGKPCHQVGFDLVRKAK
jgi:hypothetical protein